MKSLFTTALAGLMLLGTISAIATPKHSTQAVGFSDGGPVPLCDPLSNPDCPPAIPNAAKAKLGSDGGPVPLCDPMSNPTCPPAIPQ